MNLKFKGKFLFLVLALIMMLSIPVSVFGEGKILAAEIEKEEEVSRIIEDLEFVYNENDEFIGVYEEDLEGLKGTEYEYIIHDLDSEGLLLSKNIGMARAASSQDGVHTKAYEAFQADPKYRAALTTCMANNFGPAIGETFVQQVVAGKYLPAIATLGKLGLRTTVPGLIGTYVECAVQAQIEVY